jgi:cation transport ATPase
VAAVAQSLGIAGARGGMTPSDKLEALLALQLAAIAMSSSSLLVVGGALKPRWSSGRAGPHSPEPVAASAATAPLRHPGLSG